MAKPQRIVTAAIANGSDTSDVIILDPGYSLISIVTPSVITGASFTVLAAADNASSLGEVWNTGTASVAEEQFTINYAASRFIRINPADFYGMQRFQLVSNIAQAQDVQLQLVIGMLS
jgi:hypothetical protein